MPTPLLTPMNRLHDDLDLSTRLSTILKSPVMIHLQSVGRDWITSFHIAHHSPTMFDAQTLSLPRCPPSSPLGLIHQTLLSTTDPLSRIRGCIPGWEYRTMPPLPAPIFPSSTLLLGLALRDQKLSLFQCPNVSFHLIPSWFMLLQTQDIYVWGKVTYVVSNNTPQQKKLKKIYHCLHPIR